ncbi:MAG: hypothetical protein J7L86_00005, partial [Candidatus Marinimicrobia bacterium]|nr:hypothetical protein [Candidatus Neomarinimicrobiota bacterium]
SLGSVILSDNEESLMPLRTMLWRFFTSFKNDIFSPFYETIKIIELTKIMRVSDRLVDEPVCSQHNPGYYSVIWGGKNRKGQTLSSGMYFYQFRARSENKSYLKTKKMLILK